MTCTKIALLSLARVPLDILPLVNEVNEVNEGDSLLRLGTLRGRTRGSKLFLHLPELSAHQSGLLYMAHRRAPGNFRQGIAFR